MVTIVTSAVAFIVIERGIGSLLESLETLEPLYLLFEIMAFLCSFF